MAQSNWEADKMLDVYIHDYLVKRNLQASAKAFSNEGKVSSDPVAIDAPGGFLFEWWSVFWDIFIARTNEKHSEVAASYIEHQHQHQHHQQQQAQLMQLQMLQQRHAQHQQQQRREPSHLLNGSANGIGADAILRQPTANAMATKIYEERLKHPQQRDALDETAMKLFVTNRPLLHGITANATTLQQAQSRSQQMVVTPQDNNNDVLNQRFPAPESAMFGSSGFGQSKPALLSPGVNQTANSMALKGWPLTGIDQLRPGLGVSTQKSFLQGPQHFQMLTPQQQQLLLQAQAQGSMSSSGSPLLSDLDARRFRVLLGGRSGLTGKDGQSNGSGDVSQVVGSPMQSASPAPHGTQELAQTELMMKLAQIQQQQQAGSSQQQQQQSAAPQQQQQDRLAGPTNSSGPANSTGTASTAGPSPNSAPSTPSTHTPGDVMSMAGALQNSGSISKPLLMYGADGTATLASPSNQLADMDRFGEDGSLDDNVESFLSHEEADPRESLFGNSKRSPAGHSLDVSKGFSFNEVGCLRASTSKVVCCHFSSDGKLLASAGHDKKAVLWNMDTLKLKNSLEEHSLLITDVRFSPNSTRLATSSFDKTVRVWDAENPSYSLRTFTGHQTSVMSLDFHPANEDLLCSCDGDSEIRYWSVNQGVCTRAFKGGMTQTRFQPRQGRLLAAAAENVVSILDVESETCIHSLQRHTKPVHSVCWDATGDFLASVSEDSVRVWNLGVGSDGECVHELNCNGNKFHSCVFHPNYPSLLVIGCYQSLELWNMVEKQSMTVPAHEGLIAALAQSSATGMVASASHDKCVKLWK
ncbi:unnamed protein product [Sphagnum tenellum]